MIQKIFGLDLGTNSIGSSVRNLELGENLTEQLEFFSSDIFGSSVSKNSNGREYSLAAQRSAHRRSRGLNEARRRKLWATLDLLIKHRYCPMSPESLMRWRTYDKRRRLFREYPIDDKDFNAWILLDFDGDGKPDYSSPYQLRRELVTRQFVLISLLNVTNLDVLCIILLSIVDLRVVRAKLYCSRKLIASNHLQMKLQI